MEGFIARGAEPVAYSQAHLDAARGAVLPKLKQYSNSASWGRTTPSAN
jgi:hypothetical protein